MNFKTAAAFVGGAIAGNYLVRRYITKDYKRFEPLKFEQVQNEVAITKYTPKDNTIPNESPYAALYSNKK
jgi:hypothetical protein